MAINANTGSPAGAAPARRGVDWVSVGMFLVLAFALSWAAFIGLKALGVPLTVRATIGMYGPLVAALVTRLVRREGFRDFGLRPVGRGHVRFRATSYIWAYFLPIALAAAGIVLAIVIGYQHWALAENWNLTLDRLTRDLPPAQAEAMRARSTVLLTVQVAQALTIAPLVNCFATLGEEFGWRGHLLPRLTPLGGPVAAVLVGIVWGLWHAPLIGLDGYEYNLATWAVAPFFCLYTVPQSVILTWLRRRSGSVWPGVLMHATTNAIGGLAVLSLSVTGSRLIGAPIGLIGCVPLWIVAIWLVAIGRVRARASA